MSAFAAAAAEMTAAETATMAPPPAGGFRIGAARSGSSGPHHSAFLLALRNASPGTECASRTSLPHFLVDRPFAVVWLYFSWLPRWRDSFRALGGSLFGVPSTDRGSRLRDMSNFCCLPGRAGGTPIGV